MIALGIGIGLPFGGTAGAGATVPLLQNVSITMGAKTPPGMGTVLLKNLGLVATGSAAIVNWRTAIASAGAGGATSDIGGLLASNTAAATARSPTTTLGANNSLSTVTLPGASYTVTVTGVTAGGLEATCTLTITPQANAFNLGDDNASFGRPDDLNIGTVRTRIGTQTGGLTWLISTGADLTNQTFSVDSFAPASGRTLMKYADPVRPSRIPAFSCTSTSNFDFDGFGIGGSTAHKIGISSSCNSVTVKNFYPLGASAADADLFNAPGNKNFIWLSDATNCIVDNCELLYGGRGFNMTNTTGCSVTNNRIRYCYGDLSTISTSTNDTFTGNQAYAPMRDPDPTGGDHIDNMQWDGGTITNLTCANNIFAPADGSAGASGFQGGSWNITATYANNISLFRASTGANLTAWVNGAIRDSLWMQIGSGKIAMWASASNDNVFNGQPGFHDTGSTGANTLLRTFVPYASSMSAAWTVTNSPNQSLSLPNAVQFTFGVADSHGLTTMHEPDMGGSTYATSGVFKYANTLERLNNYNASTNPAGADYPNMTFAQIKALILDVLTPATSGSLDLGGAISNTIGAVNRDGTFKTFTATIKADSTAYKADSNIITVDHT